MQLEKYIGELEARVAELEDYNQRYAAALQHASAYRNELPPSLWVEASDALDYIHTPKP